MNGENSKLACTNSRQSLPEANMQNNYTNLAAEYDNNIYDVLCLLEKNGDFLFSHLKHMVFCIG